MSGPKYSKKQKEQFFDLIDRGGTVRAAAETAGVHPDAAYTWLRNAGLTMQRATPRIYTEAEKAEFFRLLAQRPNVSAVAKELGFPRVTCCAWAHKAKIFTSQARKVNPRREEFLRLRSEGLTRTEARTRVGADPRSAADWDKGITIISRGRIYPDGRVVHYPKATIEGMTAERRTRAIGGSVDLNLVEKIIHPRYLSLIEREQIKDLHRSGMSIRDIATTLRRSPSTISRELARNTVSNRGYMPHTAHRLSVQRRARPRLAKLLTNPELGALVQARLKTRWSPQQISKRLARDFPGVPAMRICTETIYQGIYVHARGELQLDLRKRLRRGRTARKPRKHADERRPRFVDPMKPISQRPPEVESRAVPGHWEGDLIVGASGGSAIATLVERSSRFVALAHLGRDRSADAVRDSLIATMAQLPGALRGTLTWDQGAEMAEHRAFSVATDMEVYFADPGAPWQRGSNENTNGLLEWSPKVGHLI
ncbi:IS30 family transposase [Nesterenkonia aurantiaca]|uniref:IS30 family transposase n=1 Tax=Nesterenkonia aurantiaca TaxID=1436010 RepID=A0A4R7FV48_9MICC|nr:IS30 family transposase [Nesterenkonia aurantiaca]TDS82629.1 IS30 family transposase [Nesterenkonia aurantiaca]